MDLALSWVFMGVTCVICLLSAIISQDAVGAPRSIALKSEFISCCSAQILRIHHFVTFLMRTGEMCLKSHYPCIVCNHLGSADLTSVAENEEEVAENVDLNCKCSQTHYLPNIVEVGTHQIKFLLMFSLSINTEYTTVGCN